jgi:hypothetical protein
MTVTFPDEGKWSCPVGKRTGELDYDIGVTVARSVARPMGGLTAAVCPVAGGTDLGMIAWTVMARGDIRER